MINKQVREYIPKIRALMKDLPIKKVWLFGSCSRGEESYQTVTSTYFLKLTGVNISVFSLREPFIWI